MARLAMRDGGPFRVGRAVALSAAWGTGAGAGVALGAVLTAVSGAGAPGLSGLDVSADLFTLPVIVLAGVFAVHLSFTLVLAAVRGRRAREDGAEHDQAGEQGEHHRIEGQLGGEVPPAQP